MKDIIESAWNNRNLLEESETQNTIRKVIDQLDQGKIRVAEPTSDSWKVCIASLSLYVFPMAFSFSVPLAFKTFCLNR